MHGNVFRAPRPMAEPHIRGPRTCDAALGAATRVTFDTGRGPCQRSSMTETREKDLTPNEDPAFVDPVRGEHAPDPDHDDDAHWTWDALIPALEYAEPRIESDATPNLRRLFAPRLEVRSAVPSPADLKPVPLAGKRKAYGGISASDSCTRCAGIGRTKRSRERSAATEARNPGRSAAHNKCRACAGLGYTSLDARPRATATEGAYEMPEVPAAELQRNRARRLMSRELRAVGEAWYTDAALEARPLLTSLWPLTEAGRRAHAAHRRGVAVDLGAVDAEARELLRRAELEARAAWCVVTGAL